MDHSSSKAIGQFRLNLYISPTKQCILHPFFFVPKARRSSKNKNGTFPLFNETRDTSLRRGATAERAVRCVCRRTHVEMSDPHGDLGVRPGASEEEIKAAFRRLAHVHHPDKQSSPELSAAAKFRFNKITAARNVLLGHHGGGSVGAPYGDVNAATSAGRSWARAGASGGIRNANRVSNLGFAVVLTFPLCLIGVVSQWAFPSSAPSAGAAADGEDMGRVHGFWSRRSRGSGRRARRAQEGTRQAGAGGPHLRARRGDDGRGAGPRTDAANAAGAASGKRRE